MTYQELYTEIKRNSVATVIRSNALPISGVIRRAVRLNEIHQLGLPEEDVKIASLLHDYGKLFSNNELSLFWMWRWNRRFRRLSGIVCPGQDDLAQFHRSHVGKRDYPFVSDEIIDAIKYHTTGKPNMTTLGILLSVSDATEETRTYENIDYFRALTEQDLMQGFKEILIDTIRVVKARQLFLHPLTKDAYEFYVKEKLND